MGVAEVVGAHGWHHREEVAAAAAEVVAAAGQAWLFALFFESGNVSTLV